MVVCLQWKYSGGDRAMLRAKKHWCRGGIVKEGVDAAPSSLEPVFMNCKVSSKEAWHVKS